MIEEGDLAPDFELPDQDGEPVRLSSQRGRYLVLYFYPRDNTPGCTAEAVGFRDAYPRVAKLGAQVFGISSDSPASHRRFREKLGLPFPLLSDPEHQVAEVYGAWGEKVVRGRRAMGVRRTTFLVNPEGRVARVFRNVNPRGHAEEVVEALEAEVAREADEEKFSGRA